MKVFGNEIPNVLIKVCEQVEYAEGLKAGNLYMKESGYFRRLEDNYRGDPYDGRRPIRGDLAFHNSIDNSMTRLSEHGMRAILLAGFEGDDKIPIFCSTIFNEKILSGVYEKDGHKIFKFKNSYIQEMRRFGKYAVFFSLDELLVKLEDKMVVCDSVNYWNIQELYHLRDLASNHRYRQFFNKDIAYQQQNEYRIIIPDNKLIKDDKDCYIMSVGELTTATILRTDKLKELTILS